MRGGLSILVLTVLVLALGSSAMGAFFIGDDFDFLRLVGKADSWIDAARLEFWGEWEPLWYVSWYADMVLWGMNPIGFHLTNTIWLAIAVVALYGLVRELWPTATIAPWAAALLFAVHPVHDEAVLYIAARGHVICLALLLVATWLYARGQRMGALVVAFLAALAKETALILPVWIATIELLLIARDRSWRRSALAGGVFAIPGACSLLLRHFVVGLDSDKLTGAGLDAVGTARDVLQDLPAYALLGGLPLPYSWLHEPTLLASWPLGWLLVAAVIAGAFVLTRRAPQSPELGIWCLGIVIAVTGLAPVFWADLPLHRRYVFIPTVGAVLFAAVLLEGLRRHRAAALAGLVLVGSVMTLQRNALYRHAGAVTREIIETVRGAPLGAPATRQGQRAAFVTLPRRYGGDGISGVYLVHHTDLASALTIFDARQPEIAYALRPYHADDLTAQVLDASSERLLLRLSFHTRAAFESALHDDPAEDSRGDLMQAARTAVDERARTLDYEVRLSPRVSSEDITLYVYSDGKLRPLPRPPG